MVDNESDQEKTEQATQKRREEAREKGQVARSQDVVSVSVLVAALIFFYFGGSYVTENIMGLMRTGFRDAGRSDLALETIQLIIIQNIFEAFFIMFPLLMGVMVAAVLANVLQFGFMISTESITPKISKISPAKGFKRLFSLRSIVELIKSILKVCIISTVAYFVISSEMERMMPLTEQSVWEVMSYIGGVCFKLLLSITVVLVILAVLDYAYQRWEYEKSIKMTKQEINDEYKSTEGDPMVKARIRRIQREAAQKRMMAQVPKADVVITNPTHLAVAISYDPAGMAAPVVVAKGADYIAEKIRKIAGENDVPIIENQPLAQVLYKMVKVNAMVPESVYRAVAEVLAYVYEQKKIKIFG